MVTVRKKRPAEAATREALLDRAYGPARFTKASERLREGRLAGTGARGQRGPSNRRHGSAVAGVGRTRPAGAAVRPTRGRGRPPQAGIGSTLVHHALREAARRRHGAVLLVGDASYYARFGFSSEKTGALWLPGPYERHRLLGHELKAGALDGARGLISARSPFERQPDLSTLVAGLAHSDNSLAPHAA